MKIKRVLAKDARSAMAKIRGAFGDDAVILSNKKVGDQVEIVAAVDVDEESFDRLFEVSKPPVESQPSFNSQDFARTLSGIIEDRNKKSIQVSQDDDHQDDGYKEALRAASRLPAESATEPRHSQTEIAADRGSLLSLSEEVAALRALFENHLEVRQQQLEASISVAARKVIKRLLQLGISSSVVERIKLEFQEGGTQKVLWKQAEHWLADHIVYSDLLPLDEGGIYALVGPSGVGKTTTIAKLAAQYALAHGRGNVALVTMDVNRIGAREHMKLFGMMLSVDVYLATDAASLLSTLDKLRERKLVLIDTAGGSPYSDHLSGIVDTLQSVQRQIRVLLTLAANAQSNGLSYLCRHYEGRVDGVLATKLDEAIPLGGLLSALVESGLPLLMVSDGQKIPHELYQAANMGLVAYALQDLEQPAEERHHERRDEK